MRYQTRLVQDGRYEAMLGAFVAGAGLGLVAERIITNTEVENISTRELYQPILAALLPGALSSSLVAFLVKSKGEKAFTTFLRDAQRYGLAAALKRQYGVADARQLGDAWMQSELSIGRAQAP